MIPRSGLKICSLSRLAPLYFLWCICNSDNIVAVPAEKKILPRILSNEDSIVSELSVVSKVDIFVTLGDHISTLHLCGFWCCMCLFNEGCSELCLWIIALFVSSTVLVIDLMSFGWTGS